MLCVYCVSEVCVVVECFCCVYVLFDYCCLFSVCSLLLPSCLVCASLVGSDLFLCTVSLLFYFMFVFMNHLHCSWTRAEWEK